MQIVHLGMGRRKQQLIFLADTLDFASALQNSCRTALIQECTLDILPVDGHSIGF